MIKKINIIELIMKMEYVKIKILTCLRLRERRIGTVVTSSNELKEFASAWTSTGAAEIVREFEPL